MDRDHAEQRTSELPLSSSIAAITQFLSSKASTRAYVIASHIAPIVYNVFAAPNNSNSNDHHFTISDANKEENNRESIRDFMSNDQLKPWLILCEENFGDNDQLFARLLDKKNKDRITVDQLTEKEIKHLLDKTALALDRKLIEPRHIRVLNLQNAKLHGTKDHEFLSLFIPKCSDLISINLSHLTSVVNNEIMECIGRYLPHLTSVTVDHCTNVTDYGCAKMLHWMDRRNSINLLNSLNLSYTGITEKSLELLCKLLKNNHNQNSDLSVLVCDGINVNKELAESLLRNCHKLNKISFGDNLCYSQFRDQIILKLPNAYTQRPSTIVDNNVEIDLSGSLVTNDILKNILSVYASPALKKISLNGAKEIDDDIVPIFERFAKRLPNLNSISLEKTNLLLIQ
jgi:hypothetical protein